jgi:hypothetical protein
MVDMGEHAVHKEIIKNTSINTWQLVIGVRLCTDTIYEHKIKKLSVRIK